jgi:hypothetical protein
VLEHWRGLPSPVIVTDDGREGCAQFNRSAAYNSAAAANSADVLIFSEADIIIGFDQIAQAVRLAAEAPGLVIPFDEFRAVPPGDSHWIRMHSAEPADCEYSVVKGKRGSIGAVNVVSRKTLDLVGRYDEHFEGAWYDDDAMKIAFEVCAGPTRWVDGPAYHLHHWSGGKGAHLNPADRQATARNRNRLRRYRRAGTPEQIRALTCE